MPEDTSGQGTEAVPTPTPTGADAGQSAESPKMIQVGDQSFTEENLAKSYGEAQRKISEMGTKNSELSGQLKEYQGWADPIKERYNADEQYRQGLDALYEQQGQQAPVSQDNQRLLALEQQFAKQGQESDFTKLRTDGMNLSKQDESAILNEIATNPAIQSVDAAYKHLFWEREMSVAKTGATADTANQMAQNQGAYETPPKGSASQGPAPEDVREMAKSSPEKFDNAVIDELRKNFDFGY